MTKQIMTDEIKILVNRIQGKTILDFLNLRDPHPIFNLRIYNHSIEKLPNQLKILIIDFFSHRTKINDLIPILPNGTPVGLKNDIMKYFIVESDDIAVRFAYPFLNGSSNLLYPNNFPFNRLSTRDFARTKAWELHNSVIYKQLGILLRNELVNIGNNIFLSFFSKVYKLVQLLVGINLSNFRFKLIGDEVVLCISYRNEWITVFGISDFSPIPDSSELLNYYLKEIVPKLANSKGYRYFGFYPKYSIQRDKRTKRIDHYKYGIYLLVEGCLVQGDKVNNKREWRSSIGIDNIQHFYKNAAKRLNYPLEEDFIEILRVRSDVDDKSGFKNNYYWIKKHRKELNQTRFLFISNPAVFLEIHNSLLHNKETANHYQKFLEGLSNCKVLVQTQLKSYIFDARPDQLLLSPYYMLLNFIKPASHNHKIDKSRENLFYDYFDYISHFSRNKTLADNALVLLEMLKLGNFLLDHIINFQNLKDIIKVKLNILAEKSLKASGYDKKLKNNLGFDLIKSWLEYFDAPHSKGSLPLNPIYYYIGLDLIILFLCKKIQIFEKGSDKACNITIGQALTTLLKKNNFLIPKKIFLEKNKTSEFVVTLLDGEKLGRGFAKSKSILEGIKDPSFITIQNYFYEREFHKSPYLKLTKVEDHYHSIIKKHGSSLETASLKLTFEKFHKNGFLEKFANYSNIRLVNKIIKKIENGLTPLDILKELNEKFGLNEKLKDDIKLQIQILNIFSFIKSGRLEKEGIALEFLKRTFFDENKIFRELIPDIDNQSLPFIDGENDPDSESIWNKLSKKFKIAFITQCFHNFYCINSDFIKNPDIYNEYKHVYAKKSNQKTKILFQNKRDKIFGDIKFGIYSFADQNRILLENLFDGVYNGRTDFMFDTNYEIDIRLKNETLISLYGSSEWKQADKPRTRELQTFSQMVANYVSLSDENGVILDKDEIQFKSDSNLVNQANKIKSLIFGGTRINYHRAFSLDQRFKIFAGTTKYYFYNFNGHKNQRGNKVHSHFTGIWGGPLIGHQSLHDFLNRVENKSKINVLNYKLNQLLDPSSGKYIGLLQ